MFQLLSDFPSHMFYIYKLTCDSTFTNSLNCIVNFRQDDKVSQEILNVSG